jgi:hypothetical protein
VVGSSSGGKVVMVMMNLVGNVNSAQVGACGHRQSGRN